MRKILGKKRRAASLANSTMGMTFGSFCSAVDMKNKAITGTMDFFEGWVDELWVEVIPAPAEIVGPDQG